MKNLTAPWDPRRLGLSPEVWRVELGALINATGTGFVIPFTVIYLHVVRGLSLAAAGVAVALIGGAGAVGGPIAGSLSDRYGARRVLIGALVVAAAGYGLFPVIHDAWQAYGIAALAGFGVGAFYPSHDSLLAVLTAGSSRSVAFSLERTVANIGYGLGAAIAGVIASTKSAGTFDTLFLINAASSLLFAAMLIRLPTTCPAERNESPSGSYHQALKDRELIELLIINILLITGGYAIFEVLTPPYVANVSHVSTRAIGAFFLIGTWLIVGLQIPAARILSLSPHKPLIAALAGLWAASLLLIRVAGTTTGTLAVAIIALAFVLFTVGETLQATAISPLAASLAPEHLQGRYLALLSFTWEFGLFAGPAIGGYVLARSPTALWAGAALACLTAGAIAMRKTSSRGSGSPGKDD